MLGNMSSSSVSSLIWEQWGEDRQFAHWDFKPLVFFILHQANEDLIRPSPLLIPLSFLYGSRAAGAFLEITAGCEFEMEMNDNLF